MPVVLRKWQGSIRKFANQPMRSMRSVTRPRPSPRAMQLVRRVWALWCCSQLTPTTWLILPRMGKPILILPIWVRFPLSCLTHMWWPVWSSVASFHIFSVAWPWRQSVGQGVPWCKKYGVSSVKNPALWQGRSARITREQSIFLPKQQSAKWLFRRCCRFWHHLLSISACC